MIKYEELVEGEVYYQESTSNAMTFITQFGEEGSDKFINLLNKTYHSRGTSRDVITVRKATLKERLWLNECIRTQKYSEHRSIFNFYGLLGCGA